MKSAIEDILEIIPYTDDPDLERKRTAVSEAIALFVERFG
jgi:hypothetical protein